MSSYENEDALRRAPVLGSSNANISDRSSKKRESSQPIVVDDYRYKRRQNSPARTRSFTNNSRTNGSISNERNIFQNDGKNNRGPYNGRPQFPNSFPSSSHDQREFGSLSQCNRTNTRNNYYHNSRGSQKKNPAPMIIEKVDYSTNDVTSYPPCEKLYWYKALSYPEQILSLLPMASHKTYRRNVNEISAQIFVEPKGLLGAKKEPIIDCTKHVWDLIKPKKKIKSVDNYDSSDGEQSLSDFQDDTMYGSCHEPRSVYHHLTKNDVTHFFTSLSMNNTFDCGERSKEEDMMYCPCSKAMKDWTYIFSLGHIISDETNSPVPFCASHKFTTSTFKQHLRSKSTCPFHSGITMYLRRIYYNGHSLSVESHVTMRDSTPLYKEHVGVHLRSNPSPLGPQNSMKAKAYTPKTQPSTGLSKPSVMCNSVKDGNEKEVTNGRPKESFHEAPLYINIVVPDPKIIVLPDHDGEAQPITGLSKHNVLFNSVKDVNEKKRINWLPKQSCIRATLDKNIVVPDSEINALVEDGEIPQKIVETPQPVIKKTTACKHKTVAQSSSMIHTFKSNTPSSQRTRATRNMIDAVKLKAAAERQMQHANVRLRNLSSTERNRANRSVSKLLTISKLPEVQTCVKNQVPLDILKKKSIIYPNIGVSNNLDDHKLTIFDSKDGGVHWINKKDNVFSFILVPRKETIYQGKMTKQQFKLIKALEKLQAVVPLCKRSPRRKSYSTSKGGGMRIFGLKVMQGNVGLSNNSSDAKSCLDLQACNTLKKSMSKAVHHLRMVLDTPLLMGIYNAHHNKAWVGIDDHQIYGALAASVNLTSESHWDPDLLVSMFTANVYMEYSIDDEICQYFNFPEYGISVAIRPGDWLLFNPLTYHCITRNTLTYNHQRVHVSSCYLKTAHVGGNNKALELTDLEKKYFEMKLD